MGIQQNGVAFVQPLLSLQYLRAIAASLVLLLHLDQHRLVYGVFGVDIFFVISGFIMWVTTYGAEPTPPNFFLRRFLRIAPLYWSITLFSAFVSFSPDFGIGLSASPRWLMQSLFFIAGDGQARALGLAYAFPYPILGVGWTLNLEMMFYALFTLALFFKPATRLAIVVVALGLLVGAGLFIDEDAGIALHFYTGSISIEFVFGVILGSLYTFSREKHIEWNAPLAGTALILIGFILAPLTIDLLNIRGFVYGPLALMICAGALLLEPLLRKRPSRIFKLLGDASYSLYLTHWPVLAAARKILPAEMFGNQQWLRLLVLMMICLGVAVAAFKFYELPLTKALTRVFFPKKTRAAAPQAAP